MEQDTSAVLVACLGYASEAEKVKRLALVSPEEWHAISALAEKHSVRPLLYHRLRQLGIALPEKVAGELRQVYFENLARNLLLYRELGKLLRRLGELNISVIALKGAYLASAIYENIGLRSMGDVDLLVKKKDLPCIKQVLLALGADPDTKNQESDQGHHHYQYILPKSGLLVEIHWSLHRYHRSQIDIEGVWSRAHSAALADNPIMALSPEDLFLHLCLHILTNSDSMRIRMLCDLGEVVRFYGSDLRWQEIGTRAKEWGIAHAVYVFLRLVRELHQLTVPEDWLASFQPDNYFEYYPELVLEQIISDPDREDSVTTTRGAQIWKVKGLGEKWTLIRDGIFPSRSVMSLKYNIPVNSWRIYPYYLVRLKDILQNHLMMMWRLARGDSQMRAASEHAIKVSSAKDWLRLG
jgi:hypothetical protein